MIGGSSDDTLAFDVDDASLLGAVIDGGDDRDIFTVGRRETAKMDFRGADIQNIEALTLASASADTQGTAQFNAGDVQSGLAANLTMTGFDTHDSSLDFIEIYMDIAGTVDISGWTFIDFGSSSQFSLGETEFITIFGSFGDDIMLGSSETNVLGGGIGDDTLTGGLGNDVLDGGFGDDILTGGGGNDIVHFTGDIRNISVDLSAATVTATATSTLIEVCDVSATSAVLTSALAGDIYTNVHSEVSPNIRTVT